MAKPTDQDAASTLIQSITERCGPGRVVIVDSATEHLRKMDSGSTIDLFQTCSSLCVDMCTILLTARSYAFDPELLNRVRSLCGAHFNLDEQVMGAKRVNAITVTRMRNIDQETKTAVYFNVFPEVGMAYVPGASVRI